MNEQRECQHCEKPLRVLYQDGQSLMWGHVNHEDAHVCARTRPRNTWPTPKEQHV